MIEYETEINNSGRARTLSRKGLRLMLSNENKILVQDIDADEFDAIFKTQKPFLTSKVDHLPQDGDLVVLRLVKDNKTYLMVRQLGYVEAVDGLDNVYTCQIKQVMLKDAISALTHCYKKPLKGVSLCMREGEIFEFKS